MLDTRFSVSIHILTALAFSRECQGKENSETLARSIRTNPTFVRRLMARLTQAGLVEARRGKSGGVQLSKCPDQITLKEIYLASMDRPLLDRVEKSPDQGCPVSCSMGKIIDDVFDGVEDSVVQHLSKIKLSQLVSKIRMKDLK
ncbi:MAG: Rrf2 family transcriptional regulator [Bdellovibrionales bacterium]|nr:Rrf2 family transcriptional regulator [Bdellovibrionales bacterium]